MDQKELLKQIVKARESIKRKHLALLVKSWSKCHAKFNEREVKTCADTS